MSANAGPDIIEDGIVFYYDTGNTVKSYIGEPTENLFGTTAMTFQSDYPDFTSYIQNGSDSIGNYIIKDTVNAPWYTGLRVRDNGIRPLTTGVSYVVSFECRSPQYGWSWSLDSNQYGGDWNDNDSGRTSFTNLTFISTGGTTYTQDMVNTWQKVQYTVYMKSWSTGSPTAYPIDSFFPDANNIKIYYRNPQIEIGKTHATQYTPTSRSVTQGLLDLTGTKTINLTDVSFNSSAQITFDGTNDSISGGPSTAYLPLPTHSLEAWVKSPGLGSGMSTSAIFGITYGLIVQVHSDGAVSYYAYTTDSGSQVLLFSTSTSGVNILDNKWHHVVCTRDATNVKIYIDGVLNVTASNGGSWTGTNVWSSMNMLIGNNPNNVYYYFNGSIDIAKIYNRALSASEVTVNFNALKTRFGI